MPNTLQHFISSKRTAPRTHQRRAAPRPLKPVKSTPPNPAINPHLTQPTNPLTHPPLASHSHISPSHIPVCISFSFPLWVSCHEYICSIGVTGRTRTRTSGEEVMSGEVWGAPQAWPFPRGGRGPGRDRSELGGAAAVRRRCGVLTPCTVSSWLWHLVWPGPGPVLPTGVHWPTSRCVALDAGRSAQCAACSVRRVQRAARAACAAPPPQRAQRLAQRPRPRLAVAACTGSMRPPRPPSSHLPRRRRRRRPCPLRPPTAGSVDPRAHPRTTTHRVTPRNAQQRRHTQPPPSPLPLLLLRPSRGHAVRGSPRTRAPRQRPGHRASSSGLRAPSSGLRAPSRVSRPARPPLSVSRSAAPPRRANRQNDLHASKAQAQTVTDPEPSETHRCSRRPRAAIQVVNSGEGPAG